MATSNSRDVRLGIEIETAGEESVKRLASAVRALAQEGDPAAAQYRHLADELDRLSQQAGAIQSLQALRTDVELLAKAEASAAEAAAVAAKAYADQKASTDLLRDAQTKARVEAAQAKTAYDDLKLAFQTLRNAGKDATESQASFNARLAEARQQVDDQNRALKARRDELNESNRLVREAATAENDFARDMTATAKAAVSTTDALRAQSSVLQEAEARALALGTNTENLALAEAELLASTKAYVAEAQQRNAVTREQAEADKLAAIQAKGLAEAQAASAQAAASELAAMQESLAFAEKYAAQIVEADTKAAAAAKQLQQAEAAALAEFNKAAEAARVTNFWTQELQRLDAEAERAAAQQRELAAAAKQVSDAFGQTGVRSLAAIRAEMAGVNNAVGILQSQFAKGAIGADDLARAASSAQVRLATLRAELESTPKAPGQFEQLNTQINGLIGKFGSLTAVFAAVGFAAKPLFDLAVQTDTLNRAMISVTGSADAAKKQIDFLKSTANQAGVAIGDISQSYVRFTAAARTAGISADTVNRVFAATANAAGNLGLSSDKVTHILDALAQMASKGVVSMEELRQQLGDSLPGALSLMAKGLGLTQAELTKLVESGQLLSRDALPALADAMTSLGAKGEQVEGLSASFNRFKNVVYEAGNALVEGPLGKGAGFLLTALGGALRDVATAAVGFNEAIGIAAKTIALVGAAATGSIGSFKQFKDEFAAILDDSSKRMVAFEDRAYATGKAAKSVGDSAAQSAPGVKQLGDSVATAGTAAQQAATATTALGTATTAGGAAATNASVSWAKLTVDYANLTTELERQVKVGEKLVATKKEEGEVAVRLAQIGGNEIQIMQAEAAAAAANAAARAELTAKRNLEVEVLKAQLAAEEALSKQLGDPDGARAKQIEAIKKSIEAKTADAAASAEATKQAELEANARALTIKTYGDQSGALKELKAAYEAAQGALAVTNLEFAKGLKTQADVEAAQRNLAAATKLYSDALDDNVARLGRVEKAQQSANAVQNAQLNLLKAQADASLRLAELDGNEDAARFARIQQKNVELKIAQAKIEALKLEAQAIIATAEANRAALEAEGKLTEAKRAEIDAAIQNAKVKQLEAQAGEEAVKVLQKQIDNLIQYGDEAGKARQKSTDAIGAETGALDKNTAAQDKNTSAVKNNITALQSQAAARASSASGSIDRNNARSSSSPTDAANVIGSGAGFGVIGAGPNLNIPDGYTFDKAAYDAALAAFFKQYGGLSYLPNGVHAPNPQDYVRQTTGFSGYGNSSGNGTNAGTSLYGTPGGSTYGSGGSSSSPATKSTPQSTSHTVTLSVQGGSTSTISTSTDADAQKLIKALQDLQRSSGVQVKT